MNKRFLKGLTYAGLIGVVVGISSTFFMKEKLVLLEEQIQAIHFSPFEEYESVNENVAFSLLGGDGQDRMRNIIENARMTNESTPDETPDYDMQVEYINGLPVHALHVWVGNDGDATRFRYTFGDGKIYKTSKKDGELFRALLIEDTP